MPTAEMPLFAESTSEIARRRSQALASQRYRQIVQVLADRGPACIFEVAAALGCPDHRISGRFSEMISLGLIEKTGQRKMNPATQCPANEYGIAGFTSTYENKKNLQKTD